MLKRTRFLGIIAIVGLTFAAVACGGSSKSQQPAGTTVQETVREVPAAQEPAADVPVGTAVGQRAPDFTLQDLNGNPVSLSDFRGKAVLLNLWSFCVPCKVEKPTIQQAYEKYRDQGFEVLAVEMGHSAAEVKEFIAGMNLTFTIALNPDTSIARLYRIRGEPTTFFIDRQGVIRAVHPGPLTAETIEQQVKSLLQQSSTD